MERNLLPFNASRYAFRKMSLIAFSLFIFVTFSSFANKIPFQGRLLHDGNAMNGEVVLVFSITDTEWSESHENVYVSEGLYSVVLGSIKPLPGNLFNAAESRQLNISVNGTPLSPVEIYPSLTGNTRQGDFHLLNSANNPNVLIGTRTGGYEGSISLYDSLSNQNVSLQARNTGGRLELVNSKNNNLQSAIIVSSSGINSSLNLYGLNKAQNGISLMTNIYVWDRDIFGNFYSNGYRRSGIDFYDNEGTRLAAIGSVRDELRGDPSGKTGILLLYGTNSPNVEITGKRWQNSNLPTLNLFGSESNNSGWYHANLVLEVNQSANGEYGQIQVNNSFGSNIGVNISGNEGTIYATGTITAKHLTETSDASLKRNILPLNETLPKVLQLNGVRFQWIDSNINSETQIGLIAQDVETVFPEFVHTSVSGIKSVNYSQMVAVLIEAVKELNSKIERLETENNTLLETLKITNNYHNEVQELKTLLNGYANLLVKTE